MSEMLRPIEIAKNFEDSLNDISTQMFIDGYITEEIHFKVAADSQTYNEMQMVESYIDENGKVIYDRFTPVIIYRTDRDQYQADYLRYQEYYDIQVYGYLEEAEKLEKIFKRFTMLENTTNKTTVINTFKVTKEMTDLNFGEPIFPKDGTLNERIIGEGSFTWTFLDGIMTSYDANISIDGEPIYYTEYNFVGTKRNILNKPIDNNGYYNVKGTNFYAITLVIPYINTSSKIVELFNDINNNIYNKKYTLNYNDTAGVTYSHDVIIQQNSFKDLYPSVTEFSVTFIRAEETININIDDTYIPLLDFSIATEIQTLPKQSLLSDKNEHIPSGSNYIISMTVDISDKSNTKAMELKWKVLKQDFNDKYKITISDGNDTVDHNVIIKSGSYAFSTNPNELEITFVEVDDEFVNI